MTPMHAFTVPVFARALRNLRHVLEVGERYAEEKQIAPEVLLTTRLIPDMFTLTRQVQIATDHAKNACARLTATEALPFPDEETTFAQLYARIDRCVEYIESFDAAKFEGSETRPVQVKTRAGELNFDGQNYVTTFALPSFFFHIATAYDILRASGAPLGKKDFLGGAGR